MFYFVYKLFFDNLIHSFVKNGKSIVINLNPSNKYEYLDNPDDNRICFHEKNIDFFNKIKKCIKYVDINSISVVNVITLELEFIVENFVPYEERLKYNKDFLKQNIINETQNEKLNKDELLNGIFSNLSEKIPELTNEILSNFSNTKNKITPKNTEKNICNNSKKNNNKKTEKHLIDFESLLDNKQ